ncbi:MAG: cell division protein [Verrucomicrobiales bacterium]|nr:cell division protein [Verrucomicrobiales bacterium]
MPAFRVQTLIAAPRERVFDLARSIDAHQHSTAGTQERAVDGVTKGLISLNEEVTWEAKHFGIKQRLRVKITEMERPARFQDVMITGAFKRMSHDHEFIEQPSGTLMVDRFDFASPFGPLGKLADRMFLLEYMRGFIIKRNAVLKQLAESDEWKRFV